MVPFQNFATRDGWLVVACPKQALWLKLCAALGQPELGTDERFDSFAGRDRNRDELLADPRADLPHADDGRVARGARPPPEYPPRR